MLQELWEIKVKAPTQKLSAWKRREKIKSSSDCLKRQHWDKKKMVSSKAAA